jgi:hypothetical protein
MPTIDGVIQQKLGVLYPFSKEDRDEFASLTGAPHRVKIFGVKNPRSIKQMRLYWQMCRIVADNSDLGTPEDVDTYCRVKARLFAGILFDEKEMNGRMILKSISFKNMPHKEMCNYVDNALEIMADYLDVSVEELTNAAVMED